MIAHMLSDKARMEQAIAPNLLDTAVDPELLLALVLANLMSPHLWQLAERLDTARTDGRSDAEHVQHVIDRHYEHVTPARVFEQNGALDLALEAKRLGQGAVDYAIDKIIAALEWRTLRGTLSEADVSLKRIRQRQLPAYVYRTIDEARAVRRLMRGRKHKPLGLTSCTDEATLFASLLGAAHDCAFDDLIFLKSPGHTTALTWTGTESFWFYDKRLLYSSTDWRTVVLQNYDGDSQAAFDDRLPQIDQITTTSGSLHLTHGITSLSERRHPLLEKQLRSFFGVLPHQLTHTTDTPFEPVDQPHDGAVFQAIKGSKNAATVQARVRDAANAGHLAAIRALYAFRSLDVPAPSLYLSCARRAPTLKLLRPPIHSTDDALNVVKMVTDSQSIFDDRDRIALPDETLRFRTGTDRDKALLLHVLLESIETGARSECETLFTETRSYVRFGETMFDAATCDTVAEIDETPFLSLRG